MKKIKKLEISKINNLMIPLLEKQKQTNPEKVYGKNYKNWSRNQ
jgi:hypothetical protein